MAQRKQDQFPTTYSEKKNKGSSNEGVKPAELETTPTLKTTVGQGKGWVKGGVCQGCSQEIEKGVTLEESGPSLGIMYVTWRTIITYYQILYKLIPTLYT